MNERLLQTAVEAARRAGEFLRTAFRQGGLEIESKAKHDFVTEADRKAEEIILDCVRAVFPDHSFLTEEAGRIEATARTDTVYRWVVDPLDGTTNFLMGLPYYAVSIACQANGETVAGVVLDPEGNNLFTAAAGQGAFWNDEPITASDRAGLEGAFLATGFPFKSRDALPAYMALFGDVFERARAIRRCGAAALDLAYTAAGVFDGFFEFKLAPWDIAAGALLIQEAGGAVSDLDGGTTYLEGGNILAGNSGLLAELQEVVARHASEKMLAGVP